MHSPNRTMQLLRVDSATVIAKKCFTHTIACNNLKCMVQDIWDKNWISTQILRNPRKKLLGVNNTHLWAPQNIVLKRQNGGSLRVWRIGVCACLGRANRYPCSHRSSQFPAAQALFLLPGISFLQLQKGLVVYQRSRFQSRALTKSVVRLSTSLSHSDEIVHRTDTLDKGLCLDSGN